METPSANPVYSGSDIEKFDCCDLEQPRIKFVLENLGSNQKVLDIGCFVGNYSQAFFKPGNEVVGIDAGHECIVEAGKRYPNIRFETLDAMQLKDFFKPEEFDCIIASEVIEHVANPKAFLKGVQHVLKKGGRLILTTQNSNGIQHRLRMLAGKFRWDPHHFRMYCKAEILEEIKNAGFHVEKVKILPINPQGNNRLMRLFAYYAGKVYENFGWTTGVIAVKK